MHFDNRTRLEVQETWFRVWYLYQIGLFFTFTDAATSEVIAMSKYFVDRVEDGGSGAVIISKDIRYSYRSVESFASLQSTIIECVGGSGGGSVDLLASCVDTITQVGHGLSPSFATHWNGSVFVRTTGADIPDGIVLDSLDSDTFLFWTCGTADVSKTAGFSSLADGKYYLVASGDWSLTPDDPQRPSLTIAGIYGIANPLLGFSSSGGGGGNTLYSGDGFLAGNRDVDVDGNELDFTDGANLGVVSIEPNSAGDRMGLYINGDEGDFR